MDISVYKKEMEDFLKLKIENTTFHSREELYHCFYSFWKEELDKVKMDLRQGNANERLFSKFLSSITDFCPDVFTLIDYKIKKATWIQRCILKRKSSIEVSNVDKLLSSLSSYFDGLSVYLCSLKNTEVVSIEHNLDKCINELQLPISDVYLLRKQSSRTDDFIETIIEEFNDTLGSYGYEIVEYNGDNKEYFEVKYANVEKQIMKRPAIEYTPTAKIISKGILVLPK